MLKKTLLFYCIFNMHPTDQPPPDQRAYEGWYAFTGAYAPPIAVVRSCALVEDTEVRAHTYQMFCERAGAYIKPKLSRKSGWFCIRATGNQTRCNKLITANTKRKRVIRWEMW